jgi:hypothetical protein
VCCQNEDFDGVLVQIEEKREDLLTSQISDRVSLNSFDGSLLRLAFSRSHDIQFLCLTEIRRLTVSCFQYG